MAAETAGVNKARPLSPHLQIYRTTSNMAMSMLHRLTGAALYLGTVLFAWWLIALATGPDHYDTVRWVFSSLPGRLVLIGYTWALVHHLLGGLRHFLWDTGRGFSLPVVNLLSWLTIIGSLAITGAIWAYLLLVRHWGL